MSNVRPGAAAVARSLPAGAAQRAVLERLEASPFLSDLTGLELAILAGYARISSAPWGAVIFREGATDSALYLVTSGSVEILKQSPRGRLCVLASVPAGKTLGEMSVIDAHPYSATAQAAEPTELVTVPREDFLRLLQEHPALGTRLLWKLSHLVSQRLRRTSDALVEYLGE
jgi:CRP-like cAMP-binding protein